MSTSAAQVIKHHLATAAIPCKAALCKFRLLFDLAFMLRMAEKHDIAGSCVRYVMCDSSPQFGYELLMTRVVTLPVDLIELAIEAMDELVKLSEVCGNELSDEQRGVRIRHSTTLHRAFALHMLAPVAQGCKSQGLPNKLQALTHQIWLEVSNEDALGKYNDSIVCFTGDLGVEAGLSHAAAVSFVDLVPWAASARFDFEVDTEFADSKEGCLRKALEPNVVKTQYRNSCFFAGVQHIIGNISQGMCFSLEFFEKWFAAVHALSLMLSKRYQNERIRAVFFNVEPLKSKYGWLFETRCHNLAEWRWQTLAVVLEYILPRVFPLRLVWDRTKFEGGNAEKDGVRFDLVTLAITNQWFWAYGRMLLHIQHVLEDVCAWIGTCPCHPPLPGESGVALRRRRGQYLEAGVSGDCPCVGMFAPAVAAGEMHDRVASGLSNLQAMELLDDTISLTPEGRSQVFSDFQLCQSHIQYQLTIKLHFTQTIPVLCCGMMHSNEQIARAIAAACIEQFDVLPQSGAHHKLSFELLSPESNVRDCIDAFIEGKPRRELGPAFHRKVGPLKFISVNERPVEALHSLLKSRGGRTMYKSLGYLSFKFRLPECHTLFQDDPQELVHIQRLVQSVQGKLALLPQRLGLASHPELQSGLPVTLKLVRRIVYRCDVDSMYANTKHIRCQLEAHSKQQKKVAKSVAPPALLDDSDLMGDAESVLDLLLRRAAWDHIRQTISAGVFLSLPAGDEVSHFESLALRLAAFGSSGLGLKALPLAASSGEQHAEGNREPMIFEAEDGSDLRRCNGCEVRSNPCIVSYFKIIKATVDKQVCIQPAPGVSRWLEMTDIAVSQHQEVWSSDDRSLAHVHAAPMVQAGLGTSFNSIALLKTDRSLPLAKLSTDLLHWEVDHKIGFTLFFTTRFPADDISRVVQQLLDADALPGSARPFAMSHSTVAEAYQLSVLHELRAQRVVKGVREDDDHSTWEFTSVGLQLLQPTFTLAKPRPALTCRKGIAFRDMTTWELWHSLREEGWQVELRPVKDKPPPFTPESPKIVYVKATWASLQFWHLLALRQSDAIFARGEPRIAHWGTQHYYTQLVDGKLASRSPDVAGAIVNEDDVCEVAGNRGSEGHGSSGSDNGSKDDSNLDTSSSSSSSSGSSRQSSSGDSTSSSSANTSTATRRSIAGDNSSNMDDGAGAAVAPPPPLPAGGVVRRRVGGNRMDWAPAFYFTKKASPEPWGSWQATCLHHVATHSARGESWTRCTKSMKIGGPLEADSEEPHSCSSCSSSSSSSSSAMTTSS